MPNLRAANAHRHAHAEQPAVEGHAALPDAQDRQRVLRELLVAVEQHVAEPAAEDHAERAVEDDVVDLRRA